MFVKSSPMFWQRTAEGSEILRQAQDDKIKRESGMLTHLRSGPGSPCNKRRKVHRITSMIEIRSRNSNHMNRSLPAIALTVPAFYLRRRMPDPKPVAQRIAYFVQ